MAVLFFFPLIGRTLSVIEVLSGAVFVTGAWATGIVLLTRIESITSLHSITKDGIAILLGSLVLFSIIYLIPQGYSHILFYCVTCIALLSILLFKRVQVVCLDFGSLLAIAVVIIYYGLLRESGDYVRSVMEEPVHFVGEIWDPVYYTAIVSSMKHGTFNAIFEVGTPINYQIGSFIAPAAFSGLTGISSHVSLWGCWMPFYKVIGLLSISEFILKISLVRYSVWTKPLIVTLFFFLAPLHPEYILKLDFEKFIWLGSGYLIPGGSPPFTMSLAWMGLIGLIVFSSLTTSNEFKYNWYSSILLVVLISSLELVKIPMYFPFAVFIGVIALSQIRKRNFHLFLICFASLIISIFIYQYNYDETGQTQVTLKFGWMPLHFASLADFKGILSGFGVIAAVYLIWGGIRYLGLYLLLKKGNFKSYTNNTIIVAILISICLSTLVASSFEILYVNAEGKTLVDGTFDLEQFVRGAFGILGVVSIAGFINLFYTTVKGRLKKVTVIVVIIWCMLAIVSTLNMHSRITPSDSSWYREVRLEMGDLRFQLATIFPSNKYPGQLLVAADLGAFWVTARGNTGGFSLSNANSWRHEVMDQCISADTLEQQKAYQILIDNNVDVIIASPETKNQLALFAKYNKLEFPSGKWLIPLKPVVQ